jgi:two-component system, OmpR family, copper resistance phosphate regulon response regulator CusR
MRILIVEDEKEIRDFLKLGLESEYFAVDIAEDGEKGSYMARSNDYDLIILDNIMPRKTGREVVQELREDGKTTPIIMLSIQSETMNKVDLLNNGADDYLTKPFSFEELLARMNALLRRPKSINTEILTLDSLTVDCRKHKVFRNGCEVYLTKKEFMLLEYLLRHKGTVLSRGKIIEHVWDMNADPFSNTIESHILSLRKKVDLENETKLIHNVPSRGYKIDLEK